MDVRSAVRDYIARGFRVVPLYGVDALGQCMCGRSLCKQRDAGKHEPPGTDGLWKDGAAFDESAFSSFDNIALAMGPWTEDRWLVALDVDGPLELEPHLGELPPTLTQRTPRGKHLVFWVPAWTALGNWVDVLDTKPGPSLDLRYARGRIVVAPSRGALGGYSWTNVREPVELPPAAIEAIFEARNRRGLPVQERWDRGDKRP